MLHFFRKYQRYVYILITIVIVTSFSFFGTYSTINTNPYHEQVAFTNVDGTDVTRAQLDQMVAFLSTDADDKILFGGVWGPNFLNDGVVKNDILATGLGYELATQYASDIHPDLQSRLEKEKRFTLYSHPQASFLSVESVWNYMSPDMKYYYDTLKASSNSATPEALQARVQLFLGDRRMPGPLMRQMLMYQQRQYNWLQPDPNLEQADLSLFGYHTLEEWFGPRFMRLISQFIMNSAVIAEQQGYRVSRAEAIADLMQNSEISYKQNLSNPHLGVANGNEYFEEQLHRMGLDPNKAADLWRQVMLFRRLFHDMGNSVFVDPITYEKLNDFALETIEGQVYRLPKDLRLDSYSDLQKFEGYLNAISEVSQEEKGILALPTKFFSPKDVIKKNPQLVQKRYLVELAVVDKNLLAAKVSVKDTWNWEVEQKNFELLQKEFPELKGKKADTREDRYAALDRLDDQTRAKVDAFARKAIVDSHPEWLTAALLDAESKREIVNLKYKGGKTPFAGLEKNEELMNLLDNAKMGDHDLSLHYTADQKTYYRIVVLDRSTEPEILTFGEAQKSEALDNLTESDLTEAFYDKLLKAIYNSYAAGIAPEKAPPQFINDVSASLRFYSYIRDALNQIKADPKKASVFVRAAAEPANEDKLAKRQPLADQWKLDQSTYYSTRANDGKEINLKDVYALKENSWSKVQTPVTGDLYFFQLMKKGTKADPIALEKTIGKARQLLSDDAQEALMANLLHEMKAKNALSLEYLNQNLDE